MYRSILSERKVPVSMSRSRKNRRTPNILNFRPRFKAPGRMDVRRIGLPPGTLLVQGEEKPFQYELFCYNAEGFMEKSGSGVPDISPLMDPETVCWLNIVGVENNELLEYLGGQLNLHPVVLENIQNTVQRPKIEDLGEYFFSTLRMLRWNEETSEIISEQLSILSGQNFVISFQEKPGDVFDSIRARIRQNKGRVRSEGADYLGYILLDMVVDTYFLIMERLEEMMEDIEETLVDGKTRDYMTNLQGLRKMLISVRRAVWPLQEVMNNIQKMDFPHIRPATNIYFKDLLDHILRIIDALELMREASAALTDSYQNILSNEMNRVMKVLTIIATIFIPLTFIAGIYGMNFQNMPELSLPWAYPAVLIGMGIVGTCMVIYFKIKKWL